LRTGEWHTSSRDNKSITCLKVLDVPDKIYGDLELETQRQLLEHDLMFCECTLKGFLEDKMRMTNDNEIVPRIPMTIDFGPFSMSSFIGTLVSICVERCRNEDLTRIMNTATKHNPPHLSQSGIEKTPKAMQGTSGGKTTSTREYVYVYWAYKYILVFMYSETPDQFLFSGDVVRGHTQPVTLSLLSCSLSLSTT
jgi:hypothetical protein